MVTQKLYGRWAKREGFVANTDESVHVTITIPTAEVLDLNTTPKEIIAAPGAGKAVVVERAIFFLDYNSIAYAGVAAGEDLSLRYTDGSGVEIMRLETTGFIDQTNDELRYAYPNTDLTTPSLVLIPTANAAVVLHMLTDEIITGDSPLYVRAYYRIIPTTLP